MTVWQPGMRCVCVNDSLIGFNGPGVLTTNCLDGLQKGTVYTVSAIEAHHRTSAPLLILSEIKRRHERGVYFFAGFDARRFRPLSETRLDQFRKLLAPVDTRETV